MASPTSTVKREITISQDDFASLLQSLDGELTTLIEQINAQQKEELEQKVRMRLALSTKKTSENYQTLEELLELLARMQHPNDGVDVRDRKWHMVNYKQCFVGSEAVDWLVNKEHISTREQAVLVGQRLLNLDLIGHVVDKQSFADYYYFFEFRTNSLIELQKIHQLQQARPKHDALLPAVSQKLQDLSNKIRIMQGLSGSSIAPAKNNAGMFNPSRQGSFNKSSLSRSGSTEDASLKRQASDQSIKVEMQQQ